MTSQLTDLEIVDRKSIDSVHLSLNVC